MGKTVYIRQQKIKLDAADLIQAGGEGLVFRLGQTAVKLYHQPTPSRQAKLDYLLNSGLARRLPTAVLVPRAPVTDNHGCLIGFQMPLLCPGSQPFKLLSNPLFRQKNNILLPAIVTLLKHIHTDLHQLHQNQVIIGDLNDTNLFFTPTSSSAMSSPPSWIDADSYQFAHFPCPVAMPAFLDPQLYDVADFSARPCFTTATDWYAFTVLLVKSLLSVHPYGGAHARLKTAQARAQAGVSILHPAVTLPASSLPLDTLSDDLLHYLQRVFEWGERPSLPASLLDNALRKEYSLSHRRGAASGSQLLHEAPQARRTLLTTAGFLEHVGILANGRIQAIIYENGQYKAAEMGIGGAVAEKVLFAGVPGYRFALFGGKYLAVNPPQRPQLLVLDINGHIPQKVTMMETATFADTAVFAATPLYLYRIAGGWIMRGQVQNGHYVEEMAASAHKNQTCFFASPYDETIAGYHRIFDRYRFFVQTDRGSYALTLPALPPDVHITAAGITFGRDTVALVLKMGEHGRVHTHSYIFSQTGRLSRSWQEPDDVFDKTMAVYPLTQLPEAVMETAVIHRHPTGLLVQESGRLLFLPQT